MSYLYIGLTVLLTVYGQIVIKWQISSAGALPLPLGEKLLFLLRLCFFNMWVMSGLFAAFLASLAWMAAISKLPLSHAYPFVSLSFVFVVLSGNLVFNEPLTSFKVIGLFCIITGVVIGSQG